MELSSILDLLESCLQTCMTYTSAECTVGKLLMMAEELPETCRVSCRSKFGKLVHLVGFIIKKFWNACGLFEIFQLHLHSCSFCSEKAFRLHM